METVSLTSEGDEVSIAFLRRQRLKVYQSLSVFGKQFDKGYSEQEDDLTLSKLREYYNLHVASSDSI